MSELEKFERTEAWFTRLKSLLIKERRAPQKESTANSTKTSTALDLTKDLQDILEKHRAKKMDTDKENQQPNKAPLHDAQFNKPIDLRKLSIISTDSLRLNNLFESHNDSTFYDEPSVLRQTSDESFERVEKMCDKSISDPNSTLHLYVKSFQESKRMEIEEAEALERLLNEFDIEDEKEKAMVDQTQLANVEAPSCMWEDTLTEDISTYRTSPVKMVGLNRPSTILEESFSSEFTNSSSFSFKTAPKTNYTSSSDQYDTANETNKPDFNERDSGRSNNSKAETRGEKTPSNDFKKPLSNKDNYSIGNNSDQLPAKRVSRSSSEMCSNQEDEDYSRRVNASVNKNDSTFLSLQICSYHEENQNSTGTKQNWKAFPENVESSKSNSRVNIDVFPRRKHRFYDEDISKGLISPVDTTINTTYAIHSNNTLSNANTLSDVSSIGNITDYLKYTTKSSQSEYSDSLDSFNENGTKISDLINLEDESLRTPRLSAVIKAKPTIIELSDDDSSDGEVEQANDTNLNEGFSLQETEGDNEDGSINISREFNDTIEEMEYIMQQGMKYMTEKGATPKMVQSAVLSSVPKSQDLLTSRYHSPSTPRPAGTGLNKKPMTIENPKSVDQFKKPMSCSRIPQSRQHFAVKKASNFGHVVSPVGAYIKNTPTVPLTANIRPFHDVYKSRAVRELEYESRLQTPHSEVRNPKAFSTLPKKAYISAEYKHVVDQRTPVVIPGGEKIHRYLQPAASVIRHEGKLKLNMIPGEKNEHSGKQSVDSSLADLSVMSGDVSLLTIKDARKNN